MAINADKLQTERVEEVAGGSSDRELSDKYVPLWHSIREYPRIVGYCFGLSSTILLYGYDYVIVGTVSAVPQFQHGFGEKLNGSYIIPSEWLSLWSVASPIGTMIGSIAGGSWQDRQGRRSSLAMASVLSAIAVALCFVSDTPSALESRRGMFFVGKLFQGFAIGMLLTVAQTYMSEVLPTVLRGPILAFFPVFTLLGQLVGAVVIESCLKYAGALSYRICFASQWPFSVLALVLAVILPESPTWLVRKSRYEQALHAQRRLSAVNADAQALIDELQMSILAEEEAQHSNKAMYAECFRGANRRRTSIVLWASCLPQLFGITLLANASYFMQIVGMSSKNSITFLILGIALGLLANIASLWALNALGRRILSLMSLGISTALWVGMGIAGCFSGVVTIWYTAVTMMVVIVVCGVGVWPASHVVAAEASSLQLRAKAQGLGWFVGGLANGIFCIILPYIYNADQGDLKARTGFVMAGFCALGYIGTWICLPEMKGRSPMEIDRMFELRVPTRQFKSWRDDFPRSIRKDGVGEGATLP